MSVRCRARGRMEQLEAFLKNGGCGGGEMIEGGQRDECAALVIIDKAIKMGKHFFFFKQSANV